MHRLISLATAAMLLTAALFATTATAQQRFVAIGTGGVTGVYYPTGGAICRLMNQSRAEHGIRCSAESTGGSVFNLNTLRAGELDLGIVQSDWQYHAYHGSSTFAEAGPNRELRAVFSLHPEPMTLVVHPESGIRSLADLEGKRVNIGNPGSGQRATVEVLMDALEWDRDTFALASELPSREQGQALCDGRVDAFFFTVGHPSGAVQEPIATCGARLVAIEHEAVDALVAERPYYMHATIPAGMYPGQQADVRTFGVGATLVASSRTADDAVYHLVKAVFDNFDSFKGLHPAFAVLDRETMVSQGLTAPLHEGAARYYREQGLLK